MKSVLATILLLTSLHGSAQKPWRLLTKEFDSETYYNISRTEKKGSIISTWYKIVDSGKRLADLRSSYAQFPDFGKAATRLHHTLQKMEIDCDKMQCRTLQIVMYDEKGIALWSHTYNDAQWDEVPPDSMGEAQLRKLCSNY
ncbi:MAG: hypothetical protein EOO16_00365 [Chitinophagaceae bacterium]|nr:MAG: hypothetical protein EOO16_00365 [Chitinophagaceae bacterium]